MLLIKTIESFKNLPKNWNSYDAYPPSSVAIRIAVEFISKLDSIRRIPSLVIPTPDEGIVVELAEGQYRLEFSFSSDNKSEVSGYKGNDLIFESELNETTEMCSIKWLANPDGVRKD